MIHHAEQEEHEHEAAMKRGLPDSAAEAEYDLIHGAEQRAEKAEVRQPRDGAMMTGANNHRVEEEIFVFQGQEDLRAVYTRETLKSRHVHSALILYDMMWNVLMISCILLKPFKGLFSDRTSSILNH